MRPGCSAPAAGICISIIITDYKTAIQPHTIHGAARFSADGQSHAGRYRTITEAALNSLSLFLEMLVIFILISFGYVLFRKGILTLEMEKGISFLVVNLCNPAMLLNAAIENEGRLPVSSFLAAFGTAALVYAVLILFSYLIPLLLRVPRSGRYVYQMLTVYGNIGFIGFPVCSAVLGSQSLIYVAINCLLFNILVYTYGTSILEKAKRISAEAPSAASGQNASDVHSVSPQGSSHGNENSRAGSRRSSAAGLLRILNIGTISAGLTVVIYLTDPPVPAVAADVVSYTGNATVFLSMIVLGGSVAAIPLKKLLSSRRMYLFLAIRMLLLPIAILFLLRRFVTDPLLLGTMAIMVSLPAGNMPLLLSKEMGLKDDELSQGIVLSTFICIVTIPLVCLFL